MKIQQLHIHNFKVFDDITLEYAEYKAVILCGRNGFGKTSIFDALELLFTGTIKRYENYGTDFHDQQLHIHGKQLVHDEKLTEVYVEAYIQLNDGSTCKLRADANIGELTPPIDFKKAIRRTGPYKNSEIDSFCRHYTRLNYLSQDESTEYLKSKEGDRSKKIETLFKTDIFDVQISKVDIALTSLRDVKDGYSEHKSKVEAAINALDAKLSVLKDNNKDVGYVSIFKPNTIDWDVEKPNISSNEIDSIVQPNGVLDNIIFLVSHYNEYLTYQNNIIIQNILKSDKVHKIAFYYRYSQKAICIKQYQGYEKSYLKFFNELSIDNLGKSTIPFVESLLSVVSKDEIDHIEKLRTQAASMLASSTKIAQACNRILDSRHQIFQNLYSTDFSTCPVCGTNLETKDNLLKHIQDYEDTFRCEALKAGNMSATVFADFKEAYQKNIIEPFNKYFEEQGISSAICAEYEDVKEIATTDDYKYVISIAGEDIKDVSSLSGLESFISSHLSEHVKQLSKSLDTTQLLQTATRYGQFLKEGLTKETFERKRLYLLSYQRGLCLALSKKRNEELNKINNLLERCKTGYNHLLSIKDKLSRQRGEYITKVISDIQILFYIYSGRIMQDSFYGRGVFMKRIVTKRSRIIFVSGDYENDLDVLYNMSSGQLISVAIAFLLALNKLYDNAGFLAIDDPVQTIDDINLWGLIETIRHEFADKNILFSTHEDDSAALMRYKFSMVGMKAHALVMSDVHKTSVVS